MPAAIETCFKPDPYNVQREILGNHAFSDRENIRVIMLAGKPGRFFIPAKRATHAMNLVRYHRFAVARAAEHNATFAFAARHCFCRRANKERLIDRFLIERAEVFYFVTECAEQFFHFLFVAKSGVIGAKSNLHADGLLTETRDRCRGISSNQCRMPKPEAMTYDQMTNDRGVALSFGLCASFVIWMMSLSAVQFGQFAPDFPLSLG